MPALDQSAVQNRLLRLLAPEDFALIAPHLTCAHAPRGQLLFRQNETFTNAWFMESAMASMVAISPGGQRAEAGVVGREGFVPVARALGGDRTPYEAMIQLPGDCLTMPIAAFNDAIGRSRSLHDLLLRFAQALSVQTSYTALSNAVHQIDERLARWILMCHDRVDGDEVPLTHDFMSLMLSVRRPSVTTSLHVLEGNRFIRAERGLVVVRDRPGLEAFAGDAYGAAEAEYERLLGPFHGV